MDQNRLIAGANLYYFLFKANKKSNLYEKKCFATSSNYKLAN
jgi:hypothetical protein